MTVIDNVLVLEEKEPVHLEKEIADVVHFSNMEGILDTACNRKLYESIVNCIKRFFFLYSKRMYKAVVRGSNLITGNSDGMWKSASERIPMLLYFIVGSLWKCRAFCLIFVVR